MRTPFSQAARDRLRAQMRREPELADRVLSAEARLANAIAKRDALVAAQDELVAARRDDVADALIAYLDGAGVTVERAAVIFDRPGNTLARLVRERRRATGANASHAVPADASHGTGSSHVDREAGR